METREKKRKVEDVQRIHRMVHGNDKNKRLNHMQNEMGRLMQHDEQDLLSVWEGWHWDDNKGGWLDPELCAKARQEEVDNIRRHKMSQESPGKRAYAKPEGHPSRQDGRRLTRGSQESPMCAREGWVAHQRHRWRPEKLCCRRSPRANVEERSWPWWTCEGRFSTLQHEERCLSNCHVRTINQVTSTCAGYCDTVCTAHATLHRIGKMSWHLRSAA